MFWNKVSVNISHCQKKRSQEEQEDMAKKQVEEKKKESKIESKNKANKEEYMAPEQAEEQEFEIKSKNTTKEEQKDIKEQIMEQEKQQEIQSKKEAKEESNDGSMIEQAPSQQKEEPKAKIGVYHHPHHPERQQPSRMDIKKQGNYGVSTWSLIRNGISKGENKISQCRVFVLSKLKYSSPVLQHFS